MSTPEPKEWVTEIDNWIDATPDVARFFFDQAEKELSATERIYDGITSKAANTITFGVPVVAALLIFLLSGGSPVECPVLVAGWTMLVFLMASMLLSIRLIQPSSFYNTGSSPSNLMKPNMLNKKGDLQLINVLFNECEAYQDRITKNDKTNKSRTKLYKWSLYSLLLSPMACSVAYLISSCCL